MKAPLRRTTLLILFFSHVFLYFACPNSFTRFIQAHCIHWFLDRVGIQMAHICRYCHLHLWLSQKRAGFSPYPFARTKNSLQETPWPLSVSSCSSGSISWTSLSAEQPSASGNAAVELSLADETEMALDVRAKLQEELKHAEKTVVLLFISFLQGFKSIQATIHPLCKVPFKFQSRTSQSRKSQGLKSLTTPKILLR